MRKCVLLSGHGAVLQLSKCGVSDNHCLPEVPTHVCFISNPSQYKWMFAGLETIRVTSGGIIIVLVAAARLFHGHIGLAEKWINFKKCVALDKAQVPIVLSDGLVCFSKVRCPEALVLYFKQTKGLIERCWQAAERSSTDRTVHLTELKVCRVQLSLV